MMFLDLITALASLEDAFGSDVELSPAELGARREKARRLAMMQRRAFGLAAGPA